MGTSPVCRCSLADGSSFEESLPACHWCAIRQTPGNLDKPQYAGVVARTNIDVSIGRMAMEMVGETPLVCKTVVRKDFVSSNLTPTTIAQGRSRAICVPFPQMRHVFTLAGPLPGVY